MPITFGTEQLGVMTLELGAANVVYAMLREQIGAALKGAALHRAVIHETTRRERAERERLSSEAVVAQRFQKGLWPTGVRVDGLEWTASTLPAYEVGGDYFDILPTESGCWLCIGDVTGHGLVAGMLMLMLQSVIAGAISANPRARPAELVSAVNPIYYRYVRNRLELDDHASLVLVRYDADGTLTFAGFHEEILVWRHARRVWEHHETSGLWVGVREELSGIEDSVAKLEAGDLLVLYSDGVVEAPSASGELFGTERLCEIIAAYVQDPLELAREAVLERIRLWSPAQRDDITLVIARRT
jgi:serine phosphatase RsbU (regulator of sigma subunit)